MFSNREIIDMAIRMEHNGESVYREAAGQVTDPDIAALLLWMADEEARHAQWFGDLGSELKIAGRSSFTEKCNRIFLGDMLDGQSFSLKEADFSTVTTVGELAQLFIEFESDTILFYEMLVPFVTSESTRRQLAAIIAEEERHIERLASAADHPETLYKATDPA
jgi:rubrerythrin